MQGLACTSIDASRPTHRTRREVRDSLSERFLLNLLLALSPSSHALTVNGVEVKYPLVPDLLRSTSFSSALSLSRILELLFHLDFIRPSHPDLQPSPHLDSSKSSYLDDVVFAVPSKDQIVSSLLIKVSQLITTQPALFHQCFIMKSEPAWNGLPKGSTACSRDMETRKELCVEDGFAKGWNTEEACCCCLLDSFSIRK